ncbi:MAG TPA: phage tail sheath C-terminal domain-containing protein [Hymenobacter sp.]|uniref:phage tail sheath family protein n=1 Tax=Hymenobacter sp. TaxID=1898978 RepID=UPI002D7F6235|nr:phage tail sheath C-terminal domain-containing protein [Hymenobacter sp.]HET9503306.1 phage tail sheath C-terminal domain-containing protein [Hymenobacter sp.]
MASTLNLGTIKTPGVYIDEMSLFPPSVAQVDTAVPAFIGPTRQSRKDGQSIEGTPTRITSMAEYRSYFGGAPDRALAVTLDANNGVQRIQAAEGPYLYDSIQLYFANGGEKCYVVSTGNYSKDLLYDDFNNALDALKKFDEPTLIVMPDILRMKSRRRDAYNLAVQHCHAMQDRFAILDVPMDNLYSGPPKTIQKEMEDFRNDNLISYPNYAAAYYPYLQTSLPLTVNLSKVKVGGLSLAAAVNAAGGDGGPITDGISLGEEVAALRKLVFELDGYPTASNKAQFAQAKLGVLTGITIASKAGVEIINPYKSASSTLQTAISGLTNASQAADVDPLFGQFSRDMSRLLAQTEQRLAEQLVTLKSTTPLYAAIVAAAEAQGAVVPPSGAIAGIYARTDADRGVWKSPANVGLTYVNGPVVAITDAEQEDMNVDPKAGKSVNAIRAFSGKGTLVWGARTLAGSDNEWRYVSVRRFFLMAEESIKKATAQFVFEANDANTWVRVRAMIENFLTLQWRAGALAGAKADNAFFVRVGLGQTMTPQDVLSGFMIIEIGMAVVRPAEFIVLRFAHKMQEA